jgi:hypothetical protein
VIRLLPNVPADEPPPAHLSPSQADVEAAIRPSRRGGGGSIIFRSWDGGGDGSAHHSLDSAPVSNQGVHQGLSGQ